MAASLMLAFASALLVQIIAGQNYNTGVLEVTNVAGNGIIYSDYANGIYGYGSGLSGNVNPGIIEITTSGLTGNGINLANLANAGYSSLGLANGVGCSNLGLTNGVGYGDIGLASSGIGASVNNIGNVGQSLSYSNSFGNGCGTNYIGGAFPVSSTSPISPTGLAVVSENAIDGAVNVKGVLPFLSCVALEGQVPSGGSAGVQYSCGNGNVGIVSENVATGNTGYGAGVGCGAGAGYGSGVGYGTSLGAGYGFGVSLGDGIGGGNYGSGCSCNY